MTDPQSPGTRPGSAAPSEGIGGAAGARGGASDRGPRGGDPKLDAEEIAALAGGRVVLRSARPIRGAAVDSRALAPGNLFVALPGERTDGHRFVEAAVDGGAAALLVSQTAGPVEALVAAGRDVTIVAVPDTLSAFHAVAAGWRRRFSPLVLGVTGSVAKTSTKEAIAAVFSRAFRTLKSEGNQNNEIGLPLTLMHMGPEHEAAVLEMGMFVGGEIAQLAAMARPRLGVVTAVREVHLSRIGSIEAIERAKGELVEALPSDGVAILNADDFRVRRMSARTDAPSMTYGFADDADVRATDVEGAGADGMRFSLVSPSGTRRLAIPALGRHGVHNALAAAAAGIAAGIGIEAIVAGLEGGWSAPHRDRLVRLPELTILDDTYNASPSTMLAALELLSSLPGRHVAVLGAMRELGDAHERGHREVGEAAGQLADLVIVVGDEARGIADGAAPALGERLVLVPDRDAALAALRGRLQPGDSVLVKASRGVELERIVEALVGGREEGR